MAVSDPFGRRGPLSVNFEYGFPGEAGVHCGFRLHLNPVLLSFLLFHLRVALYTRYRRSFPRQSFIIILLFLVIL